MRMDEQELMKKIEEGDEMAFTQIVMLYKSRIVIMKRRLSWPRKHSCGCISRPNATGQSLRFHPGYTPLLPIWQKQR